MKMMLLAAGLALATLPSVATAQKVQSGTSNGVSWTASSTIVGRDSTATTAGGGNPIYLGTADKYRGVVGLAMEYADGSAFVCSGSLMSDRMSILTAGHCVSGGYGTEGPQRVTAFFYDGNSTDPVYYNDYFFGVPVAGIKQVDVSKVFVNPLYTGEVIDQNDTAVLRLSQAAPGYATAYGLYTGNLTGTQFNVAGFGSRSDTGGDVGDNLGPGRLRQGDNVYDYAWGDARFDGLFVNSDPECGGGTNWFCGNADITYSYVSDFDNGLLRNDTGCLVAVFVGGASPAGSYCSGQDSIANEVGIAGGDSGGPAFIDGKVASVNSYGLSFGSFYGDVDQVLNSSYGEYSGYAPVVANLGFINFALGVPEPSQWALMVGGFGLLGGAARRRKAKGRVTFA